VNISKTVADTAKVTMTNIKSHMAFDWHHLFQLNSTQVYLKAVAERLKKDTMQCSGQTMLKIQ